MKYILKLWLCRIVSVIGLLIILALVAAVLYAIGAMLYMLWLLIYHCLKNLDFAIAFIAVAITASLVVYAGSKVFSHTVDALDYYGWRGLWDGRACGIEREVKQ